MASLQDSGLTSEQRTFSNPAAFRSRQDKTSGSILNGELLTPPSIGTSLFIENTHQDAQFRRGSVPNSPNSQRSSSVITSSYQPVIAQPPLRSSNGSHTLKRLGTGSSSSLKREAGAGLDRRGRPRSHSDFRSTSPQQLLLPSCKSRQIEHRNIEIVTSELFHWDLITVS